MLVQKRAFRKLYSQNRKHSIVRNPRHCWSIQISSQTPEKQPHTIVPPSPNITVGTMQSGQLQCSPGIQQIQTRLWLPNTIAWFLEEVSTASEYSGGMLYTTTSNSRRCTWCESCMQMISHGNLFHEALATQFLELAEHPRLLRTLCASALSDHVLWLYVVFQVSVF